MKAIKKGIQTGADPAEAGVDIPFGNPLVYNISQKDKKSDAFQTLWLF